MKIVFLNIWNCKIAQDSKRFLEQHAVDTDIFCLQEAYEKTKWFCKDILPNYNLISDYKYINDNEDFPQATYIRKDIEIIQSKILLKDIPETGLALHTQVMYKNMPINICNVHGVSKPGDKMDNNGRIQQSTEIIKWYESLKGYKIIGGDFNLDVNTKSVQLFKETGYVDLINKYNVPTTRNRFVWERYPDTKQYYSDYVFVDPEIKVTEFIVSNIEISDHLPMILKFDL